MHFKNQMQTETKRSPDFFIAYITDTLEVLQCIVLNSGKYLFSSWTRMQFHLCCVQRVTHPFHDGFL